MILYANGDSHTAAAEAVVPECFALDDGRHGIDRRPHPQNLAASWCTHVARELNMHLVCDAESGGSNARILRTTREWLAQNQHQIPHVLMIIQWTTWEREEWFHRDVWYQVNASGVDWVPESLLERYKLYITEIDWPKCTVHAHDQIWQFHQELAAQGVRHVFFNGYSDFAAIADRRAWGRYYMYPYAKNGTYYNWLTKKGAPLASSASAHFGVEGHRLWAEHVLQYIYRNQILMFTDEISSD